MRQLSARIETIPGGRRGLNLKLRRIRELVEAAKLDPNFRAKVARVVQNVRPHDTKGEIARVVHFVRRRVRYLKDPYAKGGLEFFQEPQILLEGALGSGAAGDCDDQVLLASAMLEVIGYPTRYRVGGTAPDRWRHIWLDVRNPSTQSWSAVEMTRTDLPIGYDPSERFDSTVTFEGLGDMGTSNMIVPQPGGRVSAIVPTRYRPSPYDAPRYFGLLPSDLKRLRRIYGTDAAVDTWREIGELDGWFKKIRKGIKKFQKLRKKALSAMQQAGPFLNFVPGVGPLMAGALNMTSSLTSRVRGGAAGMMQTLLPASMRGQAIQAFNRYLPLPGGLSPQVAGSYGSAGRVAQSLYQNVRDFFPGTIRRLPVLPEYRLPQYPEPRFYPRPRIQRWELGPFQSSEALLTRPYWPVASGRELLPPPFDRSPRWDRGYGYGQGYQLSGIEEEGLGYGEIKSNARAWRGLMAKGKGAHPAERYNADWVYGWIDYGGTLGISRANIDKLMMFNIIEFLESSGWMDASYSGGSKQFYKDWGFPKAEQVFYSVLGYTAAAWLKDPKGYGLDKMNPAFGERYRMFWTEVRRLWIVAWRKAVEAIAAGKKSKKDAKRLAEKVDRLTKEFNSLVVAFWEGPSLAKLTAIIERAEELRRLTNSSSFLDQARDITQRYKDMRDEEARKKREAARAKYEADRKAAAARASAKRDADKRALIRKQRLDRERESRFKRSRQDMDRERTRIGYGKKGGRVGPPPPPPPVRKPGMGIGILAAVGVGIFLLASKKR